MPMHRGQTAEDDADFHDAPFCEYHNLRMVRRSGIGGEFWGCILYPDCTYTEPYGEEAGTIDFWWVHELDEPGDR